MTPEETAQTIQILRQVFMQMRELRMSQTLYLPQEIKNVVEAETWKVSRAAHAEAEKLAGRKLNSEFL